MCRFVDRAKCSRYAGGEDLGCMKAVLVQGGGVSVSRCLQIGSMITVSESQRDTDAESSVPSDMEAGHHQPAQLLAIPC